MDGTITRSVHDFSVIRKRLGLAPKAPILESVDEMSPSDREKALQIVANWEQELVQQAEAQPGVLRLLTHLQNKGCHLGVLTRNLRSLALDTLNTIDAADFFDPMDVLGRDSAEPKPSPQGIQVLLSRWNAKPEETVMVGDYLFDVQSGRAAGTATVLLDPKQRGIGSQFADLVITEIDELFEIVSR